MPPRQTVANLSYKIQKMMSNSFSFVRGTLLLMLDAELLMLELQAKTYLLILVRRQQRFWNLVLHHQLSA